MRKFLKKMSEGNLSARIYHFRVKISSDEKSLEVIVSSSIKSKFTSLINWLFYNPYLTQQLKVWILTRGLPNRKKFKWIFFTSLAAGSVQQCLFVFENELLKGDHEFKLSIKYILNNLLNPKPTHNNPKPRLRPKIRSPKPICFCISWRACRSSPPLLVAPFASFNDRISWFNLLICGCKSFLILRLIEGWPWTIGAHSRPSLRNSSSWRRISAWALSNFISILFIVILKRIYHHEPSELKPHFNSYESPWQRTVNK